MHDIPQRKLVSCTFFDDIMIPDIDFTNHPSLKEEGGERGACDGFLMLDTGFLLLDSGKS